MDVDRLSALGEGLGFRLVRLAGPRALGSATLRGHGGELVEKLRVALCIDAGIGEPTLHQLRECALLILERGACRGELLLGSCERIATPAVPSCGVLEDLHIHPRKPNLLEFALKQRDESGERLRDI